MFSNYLKVAIRNIFRNKLYSFINIFGLAVGISCCLLIVLWVQNELSYDQFHGKADRLYRVFEEQLYSGGHKFHTTSTPGPLDTELKNRFPEIEASTHIMGYGGMTFKYKNDSYREDEIVFASNDFFKMFDLPLIKGDPETALSDPYSVVMVEEVAEKYFGTENPIGKVLRFNNAHDLTITGVLKKFPDNTDFSFEVILPFVGTEELIDNKMDNWGNNWPETYVLLRAGTTEEAVEAKILNLIKEFNEKSTTTLYLQPLKEMHLYRVTGENGAMTYVYTFSIIAMFILLIACINFMNLSTARSVKRSKEIGLRKVVGVTRMQLIQQFFGESLIAAFIASLMALILSYLLLPLFNELAGKNLSLDFINEPTLLLVVFGISFFAGIVSGIYPSFYLSSFQPATVLKGMFRYGAAARRFRKSLVVIQFMISIVLIIATIVVSEQMEYVRGKNLGYNKDHLVYLYMGGGIEDKYVTMRTEFLANPGIVNVTRSSRRMTSNSNSSSGFRWDGKDPEEKVLLNFGLSDYHFVKTMGFEIIEGEDFSQRYSYDDTVNVEFILNEAAVKKTGIEDPVGKSFSWGDSRKGFIKGIVKDFHFASLRSEIEPMVIMNFMGWSNVVYVRLDGKNIDASIAHLENVWEKMAPDIPFNYGFLDERLDKLYRSEKRIGELFTNFAILAIFIACLGLVGMASFMAEQKTKEIGIRKTLGSSVSSIVMIFSKEFIKWVVAANILAWPLAHWVMEKWLQNFAFRTELTIKIFLTATFAALLISLLTISFQSVKAALANPVDSLRNE